VRVKAIGTTSLLLLTAAAVNAQAPQSTPGEKPSPLSGIAHNLTNWLSRLTNTGSDHRAPMPSPTPLPRPRPADPAPAPVIANERPAAATPAAAPPQKKNVPPIQIND
jgi:hypothetical protein